MIQIMREALMSLARREDTNLTWADRVLIGKVTAALAAPSSADARRQGAVCDVPPEGWFCTRPKGHEGPCAAWPAGAGSEPVKYDDTLLPFLALMRRELHANADKGDRPGWLSMTPQVCLLEIYWHVSKLSVAVRDGNPARIAEHCADVANMAMMQADIAGLLAASPQPPTTAEAP